MSTEEEIRALLEEKTELPLDPGARLELPSFELIVLAEALEERFGFQVLASELTEENFGSLRAITAYVDAKRA